LLAMMRSILDVALKAVLVSNGRQVAGLH